MLLRLLARTAQRKKKRLALTGVSLIMGATLVAALLTVTSGVSERVSRELSAYGANITVIPDQAAGAKDISEKDLLKLKGIFWRHNIVGFAPFLSVRARVGRTPATILGTWFNRSAKLPEGKSVRVGVYDIFPWWTVAGRRVVSPTDRTSALVGRKIARKLGLSPGDPFRITYDGRAAPLTTAGVLSADGPEDEQILVDISLVQELTGRAGRAESAKVSAMIVPKSRLPASIRNKDPSTMTREEYETWYCTPTIEAISTQIKEVMPGTSVKVVRQIAEAQAELLGKIDLLIFVILAVTLTSSAMGVAASMSAATIERRSEIALSKAIGATDGQVALQFFTEAGIIGILAGMSGFALGLLLAQFVGRIVFGVSVSSSILVFAVTLAVSLGVALLGSALPVRRAVTVDPAVALRGE